MRPQQLLDQRANQLVHRLYPTATIMQVQRLIGGSSAETIAIELQLSDGSRIKRILRRLSKRTLQRNPNAAAEQFQILQLVRSLGVNAPAPFAYDAASLLIDYIDGQPTYHPTNVIACVQQIAVQLATIHKIDGNQPTLSPLPRQTHQLPHLSSRNRPSLLHGDFWPGNLLWRDNQLVAVIDWEDARVGDPLADLAISRFDVCFIFGRNALHHFTQTYLQYNPLDTHHLPEWDLYACARILDSMPNWATGWAEMGRPDITETTIREAHHWFSAQATGSMLLYNCN